MSVLVVLGVLPVVIVVLALLQMVLLLPSGLRLLPGVGLGFGDRLEVEDDLVLEVWRERSWVGGALSLLPGCWGRPRGGRLASASLISGCSFGFGSGLVDEGGGEGRGGGVGHSTG